MNGVSRAGVKCKCGAIVERAPAIPGSYYLICIACDKCRPTDPRHPQYAGTRNCERGIGSDGRDYEWDNLAFCWRKVPTPEEIAKSPAVTPSSFA